MLLAAKVKSSGSTIPEGTVLCLDVGLPQAVAGRLDLEHIALRFSVDTKTVVRWHAKKLIPSFKIGSNIYCRETDLDALEDRVKNQVRVLTVNQIPVAIRQRAGERMAA